MSAHQPGTEGPDPTPARARPSRLRAVLVLVLTPLLVVALVACGYLGFRVKHPNDEPLQPFSGAQPDPSDQQRSEVTAAAQQFAVRMDDVDGTKFDDYLKGVDALLTTKAKTKNEQALQALAQTYAKAKVKGSGKVLLSGIADLDDDSATVLVAHDASVSTTEGSLEHHYRWNVELVKVHGKWLVDDFSPVN